MILLLISGAPLLFRPRPQTSQASSFRPSTNRQRSQSSGEGLTSRGGFTGRQDLNLTSPITFQFPPNPKILSPSPLAVLPLQLQKTHNRISPTHTSSPVISPSAHQTTYSLDNTASGVQPTAILDLGHLPQLHVRVQHGHISPTLNESESALGQSPLNFHAGRHR
jgi:hypothetical protein